MGGWSLKSRFENDFNPKALTLMKKIIILLLAGFTLLAKEAFAAPAEAVFFSSRQDRILLFLNNQPINRAPAQKVLVRGRAGIHNVQIRVYNQWGRLKFVHHDKIFIRSNTRNKFLLETHPFGGSKLVNLSRKEKGKGKRVPYNSHRPIRHPAPKIAMMNDGEFQQLMNHLSRAPRERTRVEMATRAIQNRTLYSEDVKEIMQQFRLEINRLGFAKFAFPHVTDPEHFEVVYDALRYDTSIFQLQEFLERVI